MPRRPSRRISAIDADTRAATRPAQFPPERCVELIRRAVGLPELEVEPLGILPWESALRVAERYRQGRCFLAGDAAHVMPPWGGFGASTGIQDAHNLAWKLHAVLAGFAGPRLLDSYEAERRPVALTVGRIAWNMNGPRGLIALGRSPLATLWSMRKMFPYLGVGYGYASAAIALEPGAPPGPSSADLDGRPGTRAPHVWLRRGLASAASPLASSSRLAEATAEPFSTLDLFGRRHVLLVGARAGAWQQAGQWLAATGAVPLDTLRAGAELVDVDGRLPRAFGIRPEGAVLVRPDGFVAWRAPRAPASELRARAELADVLAQISCRSEGAAPIAA